MSLKDDKGNWKYEVIYCCCCQEKGNLEPIELMTRSGYENFLECSVCGVIMRG